MVVKKLEPYVFNEIPGALYTSNMRNLIRKELSLGVREPTLVLDSSSFRHLFHSDEASLFEMRPGVVKKQVESFVDSIISCKARLIVIKRGNNTKLKTWYEKNKSVKIDFKTCRLKGILDDFLKLQLNLPSDICNDITLSTISNEMYSVFTSLERVCVEVAQIASEQNCLAVIGQDSDYLIHEGIKYYIITSSINLETLDCTICDRNKLIEHLELESYHLPLFATLCGNDIVNYVFLKDFHSRISKLNSKKFIDIAKIIRETTSNPYNHIKDMVALINHPVVNEGLLKKSLDTYLNYKRTVHQNKWLSFADERKRNNEWNVVTHTIFTSKIYKTTTMTGLDPNMHEILRSLRRNIYGILFYEFGLVIVEEYCLEELKSKGNKIIPVCVIPKKPQCDHPGLVRLWDKTSPSVNSQKWGLFCESVSKSLRPSVLRKVQSKLLFPVLALHYLKVNSPSIFSEQVALEAFLVVAVLIQSDLTIENSQSAEVDFKAGQLILFFTNTCCMLDILSESCGLVISKEESCFCNFYDGVLFCYVYNKLKKGNPWTEFFNGNKDLEDKFCSLMDIILTQVPD